jgi:hypothetical protein
MANSYSTTHNTSIQKISNVTCLPGYAGEPVKQKHRGRLPRDVAKFQPRPKTQAEIDEEEDKASENELRECGLRVINHSLACLKLVLEELDYADAEIVVAEIKVITLRAKRREELAREKGGNKEK